MVNHYAIKCRDASFSLMREIFSAEFLLGTVGNTVEPNLMKNRRRSFSAPTRHQV
jgi:hypothetical protein